MGGKCHPDFWRRCRQSAMQPQGSELGLVDAINRVEVGFRTAFPQMRWIFFEPDITNLRSYRTADQRS